MHQFTSCISTDSNTKVNRHRLLYHSSEEGSGCLKKRKDKLQRSIVRIRKKKGGTLSVIRALSSHLSAARPGLSDRKEKKDIPPPTIYQGEGDRITRMLPVGDLEGYQRAQVGGRVIE